MAIKEESPKIKELREDLEILESYIEDLWRFLPLPVCYVNPTSRILDLNQAFQDLTGYKSAEIVGKSFNSLFIDKEEANQVMKEAAEKGRTQKESKLSAKNKKQIPVNMFCQLRKDKEGNILGYFVGLVDITKEKEFREGLESEVRKRTEELQEKIEEFEKIQKVCYGRELRMAELKNKIQDLETKIKGRQK